MDLGIVGNSLDNRLITISLYPMYWIYLFDNEYDFWSAETREVLRMNLPYSFYLSWNKYIIFFNNNNNKFI